MDGNTRERLCRTLFELTVHLLWVGGVVVGQSAICLLLKFQHGGSFFSDAAVTLPGSVAMAAAAALVVAGIVGRSAGDRDAVCQQGLFLFLLLLVFCLQISASTLAYLHSGKVGSEIAPLGGVFLKYSGSSEDAATRAVDAAQKEYQCCGVSNYTDWTQSSWFKETGGRFVPRSCCRYSAHPCNATMDAPSQIYTQGCRAALESVFEFLLSFIFWCLPAVLLVEVVAIATVAQLISHETRPGYQRLEG